MSTGFGAVVRALVDALINRKRTRVSTGGQYTGRVRADVAAREIIGDVVMSNPEEQARKGTKTRAAAALFSIPLLALVAEHVQAVTGRGGTFSLVISATVGVSVVVLLWIAICDTPKGRWALACSRAHVMAAGAAALGYTGLKIAIYAYPASNLLGGWALLFGPLLWVGTLGLMILVLPCAITRLLR